MTLHIALEPVLALLAGILILIGVVGLLDL